MKKDNIRHLINFMTILRIIGIPILFLLKDYPVWAFIYLNFLFFTDFLDGYFARKFGVVSQLGAILDLIADKFLTIFLLGLYWYTGQLSWIIVVLLGGREIYSMWMRFYYLKRDQKMINASWVGKAKTFLLFFAFDLLILQQYFNYSKWVYITAFIIVIILSYYSIIGYIFEGKRKNNE